MPFLNIEGAYRIFEYIQLLVIFENIPFSISENIPLLIFGSLLLRMSIFIFENIFTPSIYIGSRYCTRSYDDSMSTVHFLIVRVRVLYCLVLPTTVL